jgi:hypothetical protein
MAVTVESKRNGRPVVYEWAARAESVYETAAKSSQWAESVKGPSPSTTQLQTEEEMASTLSIAFLRSLPSSDKLVEAFLQTPKHF